MYREETYGKDESPAFISASFMDIEKLKGEEMCRVEKSGKDPS